MAAIYSKKVSRSRGRASGFVSQVWLPGGERINATDGPMRKPQLALSMARELANEMAGL